MEDLAERNLPDRPDSDATVPIEAIGASCALDGEPDISGYRVLRRIGTGVASTVYLALELRSREGLALKVLAPAMRGDGWKDRFLGEAARASRLASPCVARVVDYGQRAGWLYAASEYLAGGNLRERIGPSLAPIEALRYLMEAAGALAYLHGAGVVHRNLKPQNILFRSSGALVLTDIGIESTRSPRYSSPERARGEPLDHRHDLYALGVIAREMLAGGRPLADGALPIGLIRFQPVLDRLLAAERSDRYQSALELGDDLRSWFADVLEAQGGTA